MLWVQKYPESSKFKFTYASISYDVNNYSIQPASQATQAWAHLKKWLAGTYFHN